MLNWNEFDKKKKFARVSSSSSSERRINARNAVEIHLRNFALRALIFEATLADLIWQLIWEFPLQKKSLIYFRDRI